MNSEDRFGDLGPREPSAAERFAELDERDMEEERRKREERVGPPRPAGRYAWLVGIVALVAISVAGLRAIRNSGEGLQGPVEGERVPVFAGPLATADVDGDTNIKQGRKDDTVQNDTPACKVRGPGIFNLCELFEQKPLVLVIAADSEDCKRELSAAAHLSRAIPEVQFAAAIATRSRDDAREIIEATGVPFPVAYDKAPPILFNLYRVGFCSTAFVERGGKLRQFEANNPLSAEELETGAKELIAR